MSLLTNIVAAWNLDETSGNAIDATGNGFTLINTTTTTPVTYSPGVINNGADFGGSLGKSLTIFNNLGIDGGPISMSLWVNRTNNLGNSYWFGCGSVTSQVFYYLGMNSSGNFWAGRWKVPSTDVNIIGPAISFGVWHHLVLTYDGTTLKGYLDNVAVTGVATSGNGTGGLISETGLNYTQAAGYPNRGKDDIALLWSRDLSVGEVDQLWNAGAAIQYPFTAPVPATQPAFFLNFC